MQRLPGFASARFIGSIALACNRSEPDAAVVAPSPGAQNLVCKTPSFLVRLATDGLPVAHRRDGKVLQSSTAGDADFSRVTFQPHTSGQSLDTNLSDDG
ncbi:MAG: hypothetical protein HC838_07540 [Spirulinaceae cyanobacterium RM2_2_10]|nr:hypothetical protein [Spirulinaceae cyanobacterium RM2_2_10]